MSDIDRRSDGTEIRYQNGELDEVVANDVKFVHLEQMSDTTWWLGLNLANGEAIHVLIGSVTGKKVLGAADVFTAEDGAP